MSLVTRDADIDGAIQAARAEGRMGLDTEFMRERTYRARLCLVQVATRDSVVLIDPLQGADLSGLGALIGDPNVEIVVHAGKQDLDIFYDRWGIVPTRVFDVQVAAGFAGYGASLPYGRLVENLAAVTLTKGESYTDWCRRPLTAAQLSYAAADVLYLLPIADRLTHELESRGRMGWVREELRGLESEASYGADPRNAWRRVAGRGTLSPRQAAVLKELAAWREETASRRDIPRGWLVKDPTLVDIARRQPRGAGELKGIRGLNAKEAERSGPAIVAAVAEGQGGAPVPQEGASWPKTVLARAKMLVGLADAVARSRCEEAGIATELVVTRGEMESVLAEVVAGRLDESRHRLLQGWRNELVGRHIVALARGEIAVRAVDVPPYIEEVPVGWPTRTG